VHPTNAIRFLINRQSPGTQAPQSIHLPTKLSLDASAACSRVLSGAWLPIAGYLLGLKGALNLTLNPASQATPGAIAPFQPSSSPSATFLQVLIPITLSHVCLGFVKHLVSLRDTSIGIHTLTAETDSTQGFRAWRAVLSESSLPRARTFGNIFASTSSPAAAVSCGRRPSDAAPCGQHARAADGRAKGGDLPASPIPATFIRHRDTFSIVCAAFRGACRLFHAGVTHQRFPCV